MKQQRFTRKVNWVFFCLIGLALLAIGANIGVTKLMDSAQTHRSPLANTLPTPGKSLSAPITRRIPPSKVPHG